MSTLRVNTLQNTAGTGQPAMVGAAKAWVNFNGTGTVAIRAAFNVSSITDGGTGNYTVNFTNAFEDTNYSAYSCSGSGKFAFGYWTAPTTTTFTVQTTSFGGAAEDQPYVAVGIFR